MPARNGSGVGLDVPTLLVKKCKLNLGTASFQVSPCWSE